MINPLNLNSVGAGWRGYLHLDYTRQPTQPTQLLHPRMQAPLKIQRPFYPEDPAICHSVILHTAGGIVGGDQLEMSVHLHPSAQALITTAAASKIYRSQGQEARQTIDIKLETGTCLEWMPQEMIVFNGAIYRQDLNVELGAEASWFSWDICRFGRTARGESFLDGHWRSHTGIWREGKPLWIDRQQLSGGDWCQHPAGLAGQPIMASLVWIKQAVSVEIIQQIRAQWQPTDHNSRAEVGVTRLTEGLICRYRGRSTSEVKRWFLSVWEVLRPFYLGCGGVPVRVWNQSP